MLISQIKDASGKITVAVREEGGEARAVKGAESVYALAMEAANGGKNLADVISAHGLAMPSILKRLMPKVASCRRSPIPIRLICI